MRRREFMVALAGAIAVGPLPSLAQQPKMVKVGVLAGVSPELERYQQGLKEGLHERGYVDGQNIVYEFRSAQKVSELPDLAAELVRLQVDVLVTRFTPATLAAKQATREIPIIMAFAGNPVETGLVQSLAHPGGNVTGIAGVDAELFGKSVDLVRDMLPKAQRIIALANSSDPFSKPFLEQVRRGGEATGLAVEALLIRGTGELDAAFTKMEQNRPDAVIVQGSLPNKRAAELALQFRVPAVCRPEEGGLMSYRSAETELYKRAAAFVDKILKGAQPAELPVEQPTRFELVINMKTAKALGLAVPGPLLARADVVIE